MIQKFQLWYWVYIVSRVMKTVDSFESFYFISGRCTDLIFWHLYSLKTSFILIVLCVTILKLAPLLNNCFISFSYLSAKNPYILISVFKSLFCTIFINFISMILCVLFDVFSSKFHITLLHKPSCSLDIDICICQV